MSSLPPFRYYTDGEYEYRVERCLTDSGTTRTVAGGARHGCAAIVPWLPGTRMWKLADRPVAATKIVIDDGHNVDDGSRIVKGQPVPPPHPWQHAADIFLPNDEDDFDAAAKRLLGADLFAECNQINSRAS